MTQDVQPLTWQKRTNLEEHQQFFSKINEIIDNLAPTVDEAEAAIAQATAAIASANDAVATANAASAAASAAASQAQTAASTVAGYDARLTAAEDDIDAAEGSIAALQGRMGTAEGNITALQNVQADYVKKAGAAQMVTSQIMVPTTATGTRDTQIANGTRIQNDLAAYEPMIRNTGNQTKAGILTLTNPLISTPGDWHSCRTTESPVGEITLFAKLLQQNIGSFIDVEFTQSSNTSLCYGLLGIHNSPNPQIGWFVNKHFGANNPLENDTIVVAIDTDGVLWLGCRRKVYYGALVARTVKSVFYGVVENIPSPRIEWLNAGVPIGDGTGYTIVEAAQ